MRAGNPSTPEQAGGAVLELHVTELKQLFDAMDPAPFRERDLDPHAHAYIVDWGREARPGVPLGLVVRLGREPVTADNAGMVREAVQGFFRQRARFTRRQLQQLFRTGRISLLIGLAFLALAIVVGESVAALISKQRYAMLVQESLVIGGWVALWRPLEIFLYDWWPIRAEARLYDRLSEMDVRLLSASSAARRAEEPLAS
jgi:hypothetical protein